MYARREEMLFALPSFQYHTHANYMLHISCTYLLCDEYACDVSEAKEMGDGRCVELSHRIIVGLAVFGNDSCKN